MSSKNFIVKNGISVGENEIVSANGDMFLHGDLKVGGHTLINTSGDLTVPGNLIIGTTTIQSNVNDHANSAYDKANTADQRAVTSGVYANAAYGQANTATTNAATADQRAVTSGAYANAAYGQANTATTNAATADQRAVTSGVYANAAFITANTKFNSTGGTISGDVNITGNLNITGSTVTHASDSLTINDPLILLANNNPGNLLDTGFIAHYIEGGTTKHSGLVRDSSANTYYLFDSYVPHIQETNILDVNNATLRITTLRANLVSDSVVVRGHDVVNHTNTAYSQANTATTNAATADQKAVSAGSYANSAFATANTKSPLAGSSSLTTTGTVTSGTWSASFGAVSGANLTGLTAGNLSGTIPSGVLGNSTHYVGTTAITLNRGSASQTLTGVSIDGNAATATTATNQNGGSVNATTGSFSTPVIYSAITGAANGTINLPTQTVATSGTQWASYFHAATVVNAVGYIQHFSLGSYRNGGNWGSVYLGVGGNDSYPTGAYLFNEVGDLTHTNGRIFLHSSNYNSYSPTLTGGGASGTWGINITGNAATATSTDQIDGWAFRNTGSNSAVNADTVASNGITYYTSGVTNFSGNATDGALYSQHYSGSWEHQIAGDYRSGQIALRGKNSGTWQAWRTVLDSGNYNTYSPTLTGGGASGTWNINVGGSAGSAGSVPWSGVSSKPSNIMFYEGFTLNADTMTTNSTGFTYSVGAPHTGPIARFSAGGSYDLWLNAPYSGGGNSLSFRTRNGDSGALNPWRAILHDGNYTSYSPSLTGSGASGTWGININGTFNSSGRCNSNEWIQFNNHTGLYSPLNAAHFYPNNASYGGWRIDGSRNGWQGIEFQGQATLMMNDDTYGIHRNIGGAWRFYVTGGSGHFPGNVVAYWSDRRLKTNFQPIGRESIDILSAFTTYRFNWTEKASEMGLPINPGKEEVGLIAQDVQSRFPDAVAVNKTANKLKSDGSQEESDYLTIVWNKITPLLVGAVNIHEQEITTLRQELAELKDILNKKGLI